jgi:hypothetical protein
MYRFPPLILDNKYKKHIFSECIVVCWVDDVSFQIFWVAVVLHVDVAVVVQVDVLVVVNLWVEESVDVVKIVSRGGYGLICLYIIDVKLPPLGYNGTTRMLLMTSLITDAQLHLLK